MQRAKQAFLIKLCTVEGEMGVAEFLVNFFKRGPFLGPCGFASLPGCTLKVPSSIVITARGANSGLLSISHARVRTFAQSHDLLQL